MLRLFKISSLLLLPVLSVAQHPATFFTKTEAVELKKGITKYPLLTQSYNEIKSQVDEWLNKDVDVPLPKDPAGGYTHEKHKANYTLMFNSVILYNITGDIRYPTLV